MVEYKSVQSIKESITKYRTSVFTDAANSLEALIGFLDNMPDEEFDAFRDELKKLLDADRFHFTDLYGLGSIKKDQIATLRSKNDVISQLLFSAGLCRFWLRTPPDFIKGVELLLKALNIRPKPKTYTFHEFEMITPEHFKFKMKQDLVKCESFHEPSLVSENLIEEEANEIISFRDADYFGLLYFILGKMLDNKNLAESCLEIAIRYLERTRYPDFNLLIRGYCWLDRGMCNYYMNKFDKAITCYDQTYLLIGRLRKILKSPGKNLGYAHSVLYRGECYLRLGQYDKARRDLNEADQVTREMRPLILDNPTFFKERFWIMMRVRLLMDSLKPIDSRDRIWPQVATSLPSPGGMDSIIAGSYEYARLKKLVS